MCGDLIARRRRNWMRYLCICFAQIDIQTFHFQSAHYYYWLAFVFFHFIFLFFSFNELCDRNQEPPFVVALTNRVNIRYTFCIFADFVESRTTIAVDGVKNWRQNNNKNLRQLWWAQRMHDRKRGWMATFQPMGKIEFSVTRRRIGTHYACM